MTFRKSKEIWIRVHWAGVAQNLFVISGYRVNPNTGEIGGNLLEFATLFSNQRTGIPFRSYKMSSVKKGRLCRLKIHTESNSEYSFSQIPLIEVKEILRVKKADGKIKRVRIKKNGHGYQS